MKNKKVLMVRGNSSWLKAVMSLFAVVLVGIFSAGFAMAVPVIDMGTGSAGSGGSIVVSGGNVSGTGILLDTLLIAGAPAGNGTYDLQGTGVGLIGSTAILDFSYGGGPNYVTVTGEVSGLGITTSTLLLDGSFTSFTYIPGTGIFGSGPDVKDPDLLTAAGLSTLTPFEFFGFSIGTVVLPDGSVTVYSTDVLNKAVPEPTSVLLLGAGLLGLALVRRQMEKVTE